MFGQNINQDSINEKLLEGAKVAAIQEEYDKSDSLLILARTRYKKSENWDKWFVCVSRSNANAIKQKNYQNYIDTLQLLEEQIPVDSLFILAKFKFKQGLNYQFIGNNYKSIRLFKTAVVLLDSVRNVYGDTKPFQNYYKVALKNIANGYSMYNDQVSALKYLESFGGAATTKIDTCNYLQLKGRYLYFNVDLDSSQFYLNKAIDNCTGSDPKLILSQLLIDVDSVIPAKNYIDKIKVDEGESVDYFRSLAMFYKASNNLNLAIVNQQRAIELIKMEPLYGQRILVKESIKLAQYLTANNENKKACELAHQVLASNYAEIDETDLFSRPKNIETVPDIWMIKALLIKAIYFKNIHKLSKRNADFQEAVFYYETVFELLNKLKNQFYSNYAKYSMGEYGQEMYSELIHYYITLYEDNKSIDYLNQALLLAQQSNAFVLKNAISERKALELINFSQDSIDLYLKLVNDASVSGNSFNVSTLNKLDDFRNQLSQNYPTFKRFNQNQEADIKSIQHHLEANTLLLKFHTAQDSSILFAISKKLVKVYKLKLGDHFVELVNQHTRLISSPDQWDELLYLKNANALYNILLKDVLNEKSFSKLNHLYIVPSGQIKNISFSALLRNGGENKINPKNYLIWDYSISYLYYCAQLIQEKVRKKDKNGFIGFGLEYEDEFLDDLKSEIKYNVGGETRSNNLQPLKYAVEEVRSCAEYFNGMTFTNELVTPNKVLAEINKYQIVHISAHALVDKLNYLKSYIALNKGNGDNYKFTYEDIIKSNIDPEFVVLSACQTGIGSNISGEGLMSLCRAFIQGGCNSVMGSYWNASDGPSKDVMNLFYKGIKSNLSKSSSLQFAQKEFLTNDDYSSPRIRIPYYWASWVIYGQDDAYVQNYGLFKKYNKGFIALILLTSLVLIFWWYKKIKT